LKRFAAFIPVIKYIPPEIAANLAEHMGEESLTTREMEVLRLLSGGNRNQDIAEQLFITEETVKATSNTSWKSSLPATPRRRW